MLQILWKLAYLMQEPRKGASSKRSSRSSSSMSRTGTDAKQGASRLDSSASWWEQVEASPSYSTLRSSYSPMVKCGNIEHWIAANHSNALLRSRFFLQAGKPCVEKLGFWSANELSNLHVWQLRLCLFPQCSLHGVMPRTSLAGGTTGTQDCSGRPGDKTVCCQSFWKGCSRL